MADRVLVWHIATPGDTMPVYYMDKDYEPIALRIYANRAPDAGDLAIDILDDGVSIMDDNSVQSASFINETGYIEYYGLSATKFSAGETVTGGTSGATAKVLSDNKIGTMTIGYASSTKFSTGETITGDSSGATATVEAYVMEKKLLSVVNKPGKSHAVLPKNTNSDSNAEDFNGVDIREGSWISLSLLDAAGASGITVSLELLALNEGVEARLENRYWAAKS